MRTFTEQEEQGRRLREARGAKFATATDGWNHVKRFTKLSLQTYIQHENGTRGLKARAADYAKAFDVPASWLLYGDQPIAVSEIPIVGKAAAGPEGYYLSDYSPGAYPTLPPFPEGSVAVELSGLSMWPRFHDGEKIVFGPQTREIGSGIGSVVLAETNDGRHLIKVLKANRFTGRWDLLSYNQDFEAIEDVDLISIRPFEGIRA